jgi:hypothetical protein
MILISGLVQNGGSNRNATGSVTYSWKDKSLSATELQIATTKVSKNSTTRKFCRTMTDDIYTISEILGEEGDLSKQIRLVFPNITKTETIWCSNFQTTNPRCTDRVRNWLAQNYSNRFRSF